uniref:Transmembrane protein 45B n=1 Tax=Schistosoma japonicum TaxID=6182 RepID=C1LHC6_SCHJA|nr:Transmembrane protein 45B [Schistosoma japonicum]
MEFAHDEHHHQQHQHHEHRHQHQQQQSSMNNTNSNSNHYDTFIGNDGILLSYGYLGMYIFSLGLSWWILAIRQCYNTIKCNNNNNNNVKFTTDISTSFCYHRHRCLEGSCKILCCSIGIIIELYCLTLNHHHHHHHHDYAYTQLPFYISFIIAGLLDILISTIISPPNGIDYVIHALPFYIHSYCFRGHSYEQSSITLTCYLLISYWGFITGISIINEMLLSNSFIWIWIKCFNVILHGTWICQTGIIFLNTSTLNEYHHQHHHDHNKIMQIVILFVWYMFIIMLGQLIILILLAKYYQVIPDWTRSIQQNTSWQKYQSNSMSTHNNNNIEYIQLLNTDYIE